MSVFTPTNGPRHLGPHAMAALTELLCGDWVRTGTIARRHGINQDSVHSGIKSLRRRGFLLEADPGSVASRGWRLLPFQSLPWLPVEHIELYWRALVLFEYEPAEARKVIEDHMETLERRKAKAA